LWIVVGLGNPGKEYESTRHNVGFEAVERLAARHSISVRRRTHRSVVGDGMIGGQKVILARPMTYMNLSGEAVGAIVRMYKVPTEQVIVMVDDIALPVGTLRLRYTGSSGGHNGLESIERHLGTRDYPRIRIGIGAARPGAMVDHVLGRFDKEEREQVDVAIERAIEAVETAIGEGFEKAMNLYNKREKPEVAELSANGQE
jgi:PTH1 family peptidyl-tRNA hydrolase